MHHRRKAREIALQVLYQLDVSGTGPQEAVDLYWKNFDSPDETKQFAAHLVEGTWDHRQEIDRLIGEFSENWTISRMSRVDRSILRMAVFELLHCPDIPPKVTLNEAIDLGKDYGSENSGAFINGILDALYMKLYGKNGSDNRQDAP
ncbi:MAG: hypothetical protein A4E73_03925 [Syntrophaceae bacterium PtaU1.Bin231]|nr:MAG: hypothetical protein A4E73_03925 [Syntrophaceae bacterium PtaU1.Bin231]HOG17511.1 transcription antitermination factor NusB [Syntrophales bacterium]